MDVARDVEYARPDGRALRLDLYRPEGDGAHPTIVCIHGGAWREGSKDDPPLRFVDRGYALASVAYRLSDEATFPAQLEDCKAAVRWLRANADAYALDPDRIGALGWSAGGHLAALLGTTGGEAAFDRGGNLAYSSRVGAVGDWFGPADLRRIGEPESEIDHEAPGSPESELIGGPIGEREAAAARASPVCHVDGDEPPFLLVHGSADPVVPHQQSALLAEALAAVDATVTFHTVGGGGHGGFDGPAVDALADGFFDRHLR